MSSSDQILRALQREIAEGGSSATHVKLAAELERRGSTEAALEVLFAALKEFPQDRDVGLAIGRYRGPAGGPWNAPSCDSRNTRLSTARGPRGTGRLLKHELVSPRETTLFARTLDQRVTLPDPIAAPILAGKRVLYSLGSRWVLALTADHHAITETYGATAFKWAAEREGQLAWSFTIEHDSDSEVTANWSMPHAAIAPDSTVYGVSSNRRFFAIEPTGEKRWEHLLPGKVRSLALDDERRRAHLVYESPPALSTRDLETGAEIKFLPLSQFIAMEEAILCPDGRLACVNPFGHVAIVSPDLGVERSWRYAERITGGAAALSPWGNLVVVSSDARGAGITSYEPATGKHAGYFEAPDCMGVPAIDREGTIYLDGGARGHVLGFDLVAGKERYRLERDSLWRTPESPMTRFALDEGEVVFLENTKDGVMLARAGSA